MVPPKSFWRTMDRVSEKNWRAFSLSFRKYSKPEPCSSLVPDFVLKLMIPLAVRPYSAE